MVGVVVAVLTGGVGNGVGERELKRERVNAGLRRESDALCWCVEERERRRVSEEEERVGRGEREGKDVVVAAAREYASAAEGGWVSSLLRQTGRKPIFSSP